ncbi:hypothetical protein Zm00014a_026754, partial [Zea mays]
GVFGVVPKPPHRATLLSHRLQPRTARVHNVAGTGESEGELEMDKDNRLRARAGEKASKSRSHGSTALFVAVDYAFLLAFAGFLAYLVGSRILPSAVSFV